MYIFKDESKAKINEIYKPDEDQQKTREYVYRRYTDMKNGRFINGKPLEELWDRWERQYEAWRPDKVDWQSTIVPPFTTTIVEKALSETVGQTLRPRIVGRGEEDKYKAILMNYIFDYTWEIGDGDIQLQDSLKQLLVLGDTVWQEDYYIDKRLVNVMTKFDFNSNTREWKEKEFFDFNDVYGEKVDVRDFFIDPSARTINRGRYKAKDCIRRYVLDYDMFMSMFQDSIWDQFKTCKYVKAGTSGEYYRYYQPVKGMTDHEVEVIFYWSRVPDKLAILANDVVIADMPNPYSHKQLPFAAGHDVKRLSGFWSRGEPELLESIQDELTTLRRMRIDRQHMDIFKQFVVSNREVLDDEDAITHPSSFLPLDDPSSVKTLEYGDVNPSAYHEEELLKQDGREVTGLQNPQSSGTATEAAIFKESTMKTLQMKIWSLSRELMTEIARLRVPNIVQFYKTAHVEGIVGEKNMEKVRRITTLNVSLDVNRTGEITENPGKGTYYFDVKPEMVEPMYGSYDYKLTGESTFPLSKPLRQQKVTEFMQNPIVATVIQGGYYDVNKMADVLAEEYDFDPEQFKQPQQAEDTQIVDPAQLLELANRENELMMKGTRIEPTAYSTAEHTQIHLAFMGSDAFKKGMNEEIAKNFAYHIMGENQAQQMRGQGQPEATFNGSGQPEQNMMQGYEGAGIMKGETKATNPNKVIGSEMLPKGINAKLSR
jgi:hypothetical protein